MYDKELVVDVLQSILSAAGRIAAKMASISSADDFHSSEENRDTLDVLCMQLSAIGEGLKQVDRITEGKLLSAYPQVDWKGLKGIRDVIAHQYFDISAEAIYYACENDVAPLAETVKTIIKEITA